MRISDWSSDVCSSDLQITGRRRPAVAYLGVEMAKEKIAPHFVHRIETRRAVAEESGAVAAFGRQIMDERDAVSGDSADMRQALRDRQLAGQCRADRIARIDARQRPLPRSEARRVRIQCCHTSRSRRYPCP